ncbi:MAG: 2-succinyl-5-enolpyruvyl-6-hydroxy-3-cyclohexene-1-carboxylic-acid synthase [Polyangiaceae bacterium]|jgi:2-succinyl-5-enolpyruvyl-6-hydroxy-3-cyclohexene-1-carboxylate synthase|nr:2-succinyl-5-enolpyruvyl-6-hydroxy-3-cyclohexene-1-carboxylic-acid synthase [Polyangiaceae bacterium]
MTERNLLTEWAWLLMRSLADAGVVDLVISPGARSIPFAAAAVAEPRLRRHIALDERAAAFFALGQARATGRPSALLCTSGTAGAHYYPAVIEASQAFVPLIVLTADRPPELQHCAAPQTVDQARLYGPFVRHFASLSAPESSDISLRGLRRACAQAALLAVHPTPGPVHLNVPAREPLDPFEPRSDAEHALRARVRRAAAEPIIRAFPPVATPAPASVRAVVEACAGTARGLIACGPLAPAEAYDRALLFELARRTGYPIFWEATSQARFGPVPPDVVACDQFELLVRHERFWRAHAPELVLQFGTPFTSGGWRRFLAAFPPLRRVVVASQGWQDPHSSAWQLLLGPVGAALAALVDALGPAPTVSPTPPAPSTSPASPAFSAFPTPDGAAWRRAIAAASREASAAVAEGLADDDALSEGGAVRALTQHLPPSSYLVIGNSLALRHLDAYGHRATPAVSVVHQRGVNGIDGHIATAAGVASVAGGGPVTLLLGDVSFLHDVSALALAREAASPLVVIVLQNRGGRIFELLPIANTLDAQAMRHAITPHAFDLSHAAALYGVAFARAHSEAELVAALAAAYARPGCSLVEAIVPEHGAVAQYQRIDALAAHRLEALTPP